jgi:protein-S-isoprenylcysteine O-methyltransferase Ste14
MATHKMALFTVMTVVAQFALAILGWDGFTAFFSHPALISLAIATVVLTVAALLSRGNMSSGEHEDRGNRWVLLMFGALTILIAYLPAYTDRKGFCTFDWEPIRWVGIFLFVTGGVLRLWPVYVLGRRFSGLVAIQPDHRLVTTGIYRVIRNPSYLGMLVSTLGWALVFRSGIGVLLMMLCIPPLIARMNAEEKLLRAQFGSEYNAYCARTVRLIPGLY